MSEASSDSLRWFDAELKKHFELTTEILGPDSGQVSEIRLLNRVLRWQTDGVAWEPDQRHVEMIVQQLGLEGSKSVCTPGNHDSDENISHNIDGSTGIYAVNKSE